MAFYLLTGGCGFIGSHLADRLLELGHRVRVLDDLSTGKRENLDPRAEFRQGCVTDTSQVDNALEEVDGCFHLAAIASVERSHRDWLTCHHINVGALVGLFEAIVRRGTPIPVVYASSAAVYGRPAVLPLTEDSPARPISAYGADKLACELQARVAGEVFGLPSFGPRLFNVFGPRQDPSSPYTGVISLFRARARDGGPLPIHGDGFQTRDFVHVLDVVEAFRLAMEHADPSAPVANICTGEPTSVRQIALTLVGGDVARLVHGPARWGDIPHSHGLASVAREVLGWRATRRVEAYLGTAVEKDALPSRRASQEA